MTAPASEQAATALTPRPFRVINNTAHTHDTVTLAMEPVDGVPFAFAPGQFTMIGTLGAGEAPISISGDPSGAGPLEHTVRDVGGVSHALTSAGGGDILTVRGPYGTGWQAADGVGGDLLIIAGGIGLAPLRSAVLEVLARRDEYRHVSLLYGTREPTDRVFRNDLAAWARQGAIDVGVTVDHAGPGWPGRVGLVTGLIAEARFEPERTLALVCGPEVMMRVVADTLVDGGMPPEAVRVSLERNMMCGIGLCGHCQLREYFICTDGPVFSYPQVAGLMAIREY